MILLIPYCCFRSNCLYFEFFICMWGMSMRQCRVCVCAMFVGAALRFHTDGGQAFAHFLTDFLMSQSQCAISGWQPHTNITEPL